MAVDFLHGKPLGFVQLPCTTKILIQRRHCTQHSLSMGSASLGWLANMELWVVWTNAFSPSQNSSYALHKGVVFCGSWHLPSHLPCVLCCCCVDSAATWQWVLYKSFQWSVDLNWIVGNVCKLWNNRADLADVPTGALKTEMFPDWLRLFAGKWLSCDELTTACIQVPVHRARLLALSSVTNCLHYFPTVWGVPPCRHWPSHFIKLCRAWKS